MDGMLGFCAGVGGGLGVDAIRTDKPDSRHAEVVWRDEVF